MLVPALVELDDINTIRGWLGHVSIDTTNIYAGTDLEMKANALHLVNKGDHKIQVMADKRQ